MLTRIKHPGILKKLSLERAAEPEQENNIETLSRCTDVHLYKHNKFGVKN